MQTRAKILLACLLLAALLCGILLKSMAHLPASTVRGGPEKITWDLRKGRTPAAVDWPAAVPGAWYEREGEFDLTVIGRMGNVIFHQRVQHFNVERRGDQLGLFIFQFASGSNGEQAYQIMKQVMTDWNFVPETFSDLEKWHDALTSKTSYPDFVKLHERLKDMHNDLDYALYPGFKAGGGGDMEIRASDVWGHSPEAGDIQFTLTFTF